MARHHGPPVVLLAEASPLESATYATYFRAHGYETIECAGSADALRRAAQADVIVTGIRIPGPFDGIELLRRLRSSDGTAAVIVLSACTAEPDQMRAMQAGCDMFVAKPCLPETLLAHVISVIDRTRARRHPPRRTS